MVSLARKSQKVQKYLAVVTILATLTPASGTVLKFMAQRSLAAEGVQTDPHCSSGIVSLKKFPDDKGSRSCCAGYCGACNDYDICKSVRGQDSQYACCASKVYERRCGKAPANVCLKTCSESMPPCIMDIDVDSMVTPKGKNVTGVPDCGEVVPHVRSMHANAVDKGDTLTDIHRTITQLHEAVSFAKNAQAKAKTDIEDRDIPDDYKTKIEAEAKHAQTVIDFVEKHQQKVQEVGQAVNAVVSWEKVPHDVKVEIEQVSLEAARDDKEARGSLSESIGLHQEAYIAVAKIAQKQADEAAAEAAKKKEAARKAAEEAAETARKAAEEKAAKEAAEAAAAAKKAAEEAAAAAKAAEEAAAKAKKEAEEKARKAGLNPAWQQPSGTWSEWPKNPHWSTYWVNKSLQDSCGTLLEQKSFSLSLWAKQRAAAFGSEAYLVTTRGPGAQSPSYMQFGIHNPPGSHQNLFFRIQNDCHTGNLENIDLFEEHHYVATFDATTNTQKIFFDGQLLATCTAPAPLTCPSNDPTVYVGCWGAADGSLNPTKERGCEYHMTGDMRATKIFSGRVLTIDEIQEEVKAGQASML